MKKSLVPNTKVFTVKELAKMEVPPFQRWIVQKNKESLKQSIEDIGLLRCPVIAYVKTEKKNYVIDGNHIREILVENELPSSEIVCIYKEVLDYDEASMIFKLLNTRGKQLDWVDITNLYMHTSVYVDNVYKQIWSLIGNPKNSKEVVSYKGFSLPTIIEILCGVNKQRYREGLSKTDDVQNYVLRKNLLVFLLQEAELSWDKEFAVNNLKKPSGAAVIGFINCWFKNGYFKNYTDQQFLMFINQIFRDNCRELKVGKLIINRENSPKMLEEKMATLKVPVELEA